MNASGRNLALADAAWLRQALRLARRGRGATSPNPMVGAVLVQSGEVIGRGWHHRAGEPHAEIEALRNAQRRGHAPRGATLYVTLEPCCTRGRTPPCTDAILVAGIRRVVIGTIDPNPDHRGKGVRILRRAGVTVDLLANLRSADDVSGRDPGRLKVELEAVARECAELNEAFNHWIVHGTPFVTVKAAMTLDGKIATARGESKWITGEKARVIGMRLRRDADAILVGVNTVLADDPSLTVRLGAGNLQPSARRRIVLDSMARTPLAAKVVSDEFAAQTTIVVSSGAPKSRVAALARRVRVLLAPVAKSRRTRSGFGIPLPWLLRKLGTENVTNLVVEGGGEVNASFLLGGLAQRVVFFYAPKILGGRDSRSAVAGKGAGRWRDVLDLHGLEWRRVGLDLMLTARVVRACR